MITKLTCIASTASENGGFILKLQSKLDKVVASAFGVTTQKQQATYYMKVGQPCTVGFTANLDLSNYKVTEMPYVLPDGAENAGETVQLKWLFL